MDPPFSYKAVIYNEETADVFTYHITEEPSKYGWAWCRIVDICRLFDDGRVAHLPTHNGTYKYQNKLYRARICKYGLKIYCRSKGQATMAY